MSTIMPPPIHPQTPALHSLSLTTSSPVPRPKQSHLVFSDVPAWIMWFMKIKHLSVLINDAFKIWGNRICYSLILNDSVNKNVIINTNPICLPFMFTDRGSRVLTEFSVMRWKLFWWSHLFTGSMGQAKDMYMCVMSQLLLNLSGCGFMQYGFTCRYLLCCMPYNYRHTVIAICNSTGWLNNC